MIKYNADMTVFQKENVMGGTGAYTYTEMLSGEDCPKTRLFGCNTLNPGVSIGRHAHTGEGEAYIILDGEAVVEEDGVEYYTEIEDDDEYETVADAFVDRLEDFFEIENK